jgi:hypothetical protein
MRIRQASASTGQRRGDVGLLVPPLSRPARLPSVSRSPAPMMDDGWTEDYTLRTALQSV